MNTEKTMMKKRIVPVVLATTMLLGGCVAAAAAMPLIAKIVAVASEAIAWIDAIDSFTDQAFAQRPNPALEATIDQALVRARAAAALLNSAGHGAQSLNDEQLQQAFADFKAAYDSLLLLVQPLGVDAGAAGGGPVRMGASSGRLRVPTSDELKARAQQ